MAHKNPYQRVGSVPEPDPANISNISNNDDNNKNHQERVVQFSSSSTTVTTPELKQNIDEVNTQSVIFPHSSYSPMTTTATMVSSDQQSHTSTSPILYEEPMPSISPSPIPSTDSNQVAPYENLPPPPNYQNLGQGSDVKQPIPTSHSSSHLPPHSAVIEMGTVGAIRDDEAIKVANSLQSDRSVRM
ncbi:8658_t:CDS:2, partial [Ambispora leptoticha]